MHTQQKDNSNNKYKDYNEIEDASKCVIELIKCSLHNELPVEIPQKVNWAQVLYLAANNSVVSMISPAVKRYKGDIPENIRKKIEAALLTTIYRLLNFQIERENIFAKMEQEGIAYLPLKGILLAEYYPVAGMRWMCDNDILYGKNDSEQGRNHESGKLKDIMLGLGYHAVHTGGVHDVYQKEPFFNFEMHRKLVSANSPFAKYYENPWEKAILVKGKKYEYRFSDEDEYIFMLAHAYKHFDNSGCGIRTLVDEYVYVDKKKCMDWRYIDEQLRKIGLNSFEKSLKNAAIAAFSEDGVITEQEWDIISYMFNCGTYGTMSNRIRRELKRIQSENALNQVNTKWHYIRKRFFVSEVMIQENYLFFYRHKNLRWLLPFYRILKGLIIHPKMLYYEWKNVRNFK